ncbi:MAG: 50S ribosomal protein L22 [Acidimicrobiia bacterium]
MPETSATLRHCGTSATKVRQVLGLIRGLDVNDAREVLRFCERGAADEVAKLLDSAVANAEHNDLLPPDELFVSRAWADEGPTAERYRPRARGRGTRIRKRSSHVTIVVARYSEDDLLARTARETASGSGAAADRRRRLTRRRRVAASTAAETETHDHDHDHDDVFEDEAEETAVDEAEVEETEVEETEDEASETPEPEAQDETEAADTSSAESSDERSEAEVAAPVEPEAKK